ncbi:MAG TPA: 4-(cytidine 5'-diphospho)-2-C-methyl-D-erythritol kinase [Bryobacteraceae bacterium]|nr:4-(cytidine 5'-diphospho)-2-C-methyl-D-erythritol kinase [Bryobacteraceae bacterium]
MHVTVPSFAKLNLDLRVLGKRPDGYHELRTIFQTVSLKDTLSIDFDFARRTQIDLSSSVDIADNLVVRSAKSVLQALKVHARVRFVLDKRIPIGAGLGGGSSNAAAVLLALPALAGKHISQPDLFRLAESLGSDVPFFLYGGTALGLGRGTELYPLPDLPASPALIVSSGIHVSTREAYAALGRNVTDPLTSAPESPILREFQTIAWTLDGSSLDRLPLTNDFEKAVFQMHATLPSLARKLRRLGARPVRMTGSGSGLFGIFRTSQASQAAASEFRSGTAFPVRFVPRRQYNTAWRRALGRLTGASLMSGG